MAETYRLRYDGLTTTLGAAISSTGATSITFASALQTMGTNIPTLAADQYIVLVIDNEIIYLTAYTSAATTGTISRGKEGTTAATHSNGATVIHAPTVQDFSSVGGSSVFSGVKAYNAGTQNVPTVTETAALFDSEEYDTDNYHSTSSNTGRITVPVDGYYTFTFSAYWNSQTEPVMVWYFRKNGTTALRGKRRIDATVTALAWNTLTHTVFLSAGDYVEAIVYHSGAATEQLGTAGYETTFECTKIAGAAGAPVTAVRAYRSAALTGFANATPTAVSLDAESFDTGTMHDNTTNPTRITIVAAGKYLVTGRFEPAISSGAVQARIHLNGTLVRLGTYTADANSTAAQVVDVLDLVAGDYLELFGYQASGGTCSVNTGASSTFLAAVLLDGGASSGGDTVTAAKTANYTAASGELVPCNAAAGGFTVTLPAATSGRYVTVIKTDSSANIVTVVGASGATINGDSAGYIVSQYTSITLVADGTNWVVKSAYGEGTASDQIWTTVADLPLTTLTGWTTGTGSWSASASGIRQATSSASRKGLFFDTQFDQADCIVEAEIKVDTSTSTVNGRCGFLFDGPPADTSGGTTVLLVTSGSLTVVSQLYFEQDQVLAGPTMTLASTFATGVWKKFRVHKSGRQFTAYVDGVLVGQSHVPLSPNAPRETKRLMLYSYETDCSWRNLKIWTARLPT